MLGVELVAPDTKDPLPVDLVLEFHEKLKDLGVLVARGGRWNNVRTAIKRFHIHSTYSIIYLIINSASTLSLLSIKFMLKAA